MLDDIIVSGLAGGLIVFIILGSVKLALFIKRFVRDVDFRKSLSSGITRAWRLYRAVLIVVAVIGSLFYWYELRPSRIKHECSWVEYKVNAQPADPGITREEEALSKERYEACIENDRKRNPPVGGGMRLIPDCEYPVAYKEPSLATLERTETREATEEEYRFCLRDKGL